MINFHTVKSNLTIFISINKISPVWWQGSEIRDQEPLSGAKHKRSGIRHQTSTVNTQHTTMTMLKKGTITNEKNAVLFC